MRICLIGPRDAGKTKTARRLALALKMPVVSTDVLISYECEGKPIPDIIRAKGGGIAAWRFFRQKEFEVMRKAARLRDVIIDCGGGIVVDLDAAGNEVFSARKVRLLRDKSVVVWLRPGKVKDAPDADRPSLSRTLTQGQVMKRREPFYRKAAHVVINVRDDGGKSLGRRALRKLRSYIP